MGSLRNLQTVGTLAAREEHQLVLCWLDSGFPSARMVADRIGVPVNAVDSVIQVLLQRQLIEPSGHQCK